jgi:hypothetical protein
MREVEVAHHRSATSQVYLEKSPQESSVESLGQKKKKKVQE